MAEGLKTEIVTVPRWESGRDGGKMFLLTEMDAVRAEKWAMRALLLLRGSDQRVPDSVAGVGWERIAIIGINVFLSGSIKFGELEPLMDEMFECVQIIRDPKNIEHATPIVSATDIVDVRTRLWLRSEVLRMHTGFSPAVALSRLMEAVAIKDSLST